MKSKFSIYGLLIMNLALLVNPLQDTVAEVAKKWTKVARTGAVEVKFSVVDLSTIMFTMQKGQDSLEVSIHCSDNVCY